MRWFGSGHTEYSCTSFILSPVARAELKRGRRKQVCDALRHGMRLDMDDAGLRALREAEC